MTTDRRPPSTSDLADTIDEADQPRARTGPVEERVVDPFVDAPPDDPRAPRNVDLSDRVTALELGRSDADARIKAAHLLAENASRWGRRIFYALSGFAGVAGTALVFAFSVARSRGAAAGEKRAQNIERARYIAIIDRLAIDVARHDGILSSLVEAIRSRYPIGALPILGPPRQDQTPP